MKFFFPDSMDLVDPSFDFETERRNDDRVRQRDDQYAHEVLGAAPFDGVLVSKSIVDGVGGAVGRFSIGQRHRLLREGVRKFFRLDEVVGKRLETMGDCGAFSYVREDTPPYTTDSVIDFYEQCGFDRAVSVDHVILGYKAQHDHAFPEIDPVPPEWRRRQELSIELAAEFRRRCIERRVSFLPLAVLQGWSPKSYTHALTKAQKMGYRDIAVGGLVPLKSREILEVLAALSDAREPDTQFHLFGVTRCEHIDTFSRYGATSFDSTSPLRQAFMDERDNYYAMDRTFTAIRVPQVDGNPKLKRLVLSGQVQQAAARELERESLLQLRLFAAGKCSLDHTIGVIGQYTSMFDDFTKWEQTYRDTLRERPWERCNCAICRAIGIDVVLFRGAERNRRRGFHNLFVFAARLQDQAIAQSIAGSSECLSSSSPASPSNRVPVAVSSPSLPTGNKSRHSQPSLVSRAARRARSSDTSAPKS